MQVDSQIMIEDFETTPTLRINSVELTEVKKGSNGISDNSKNIPEKFKKNNTQLLNEVMNVNVDGLSNDEAFCFEVKDVTDLTLPVINKISLSYNSDVVERLTPFDKEVMDAVATLAPLQEVLSATLIFRTISGKTEGVVNKSQREKINESMQRCMKYLVEIDLTSQYKNMNPDEAGELDHLKFRGYLIPFSSIDKKTSNGSNYYYKIYDMPPLFRLAESIGKVSAFPLELLDTPVNKTEQIIVIQGHLLREIDNIKKNLRESSFIPWDELYHQVDLLDARKQQKQRLREYVKTILDFWVSKNFITDYEQSTQSKLKGITIFTNSKGGS